MKTSLLLPSVLLSVVLLNAQEHTEKKKYYCAPCGCENDDKVFEEPGTCPACKMHLLEIGTFNFHLGSVFKNELIVYLSNKKDNKENLFYRNLKTAAEKLIGQGSSPQFSPDGKTIVFTQGENSLLMYHVRTDSVTKLNSTINLPSIQTPSWNSSGTTIIFSAGTFPNIGIYELIVETGTLQQIITSEGLRYAAVASPDGKILAYRCVKGNEKERQKGIAVYDRLTKEERYVCTIGEYCTWAPDGKQLAFHWPDSSHHFCIYTVNLDGTALKKIAGAENANYELPFWSSDGKTIYFQTNKRNGNWEIWSMNIDGSDQKPIIWQ
jgi:Tol biopolymer transport system component